MTSKVQLGSSQFISVKEAAVLVSCSRDYVTKLAREGKITASQNKRQWFVDENSLKNFFEFSQYEVEVRSKHLREIRKKEILLRQELAKKVNSLKIKHDRSVRLIAGHSFLIMLCGIGAGFLLNFVSVYLPTSRVTQLAETPSAMFSNLFGMVADHNGNYVSEDLTISDSATETFDNLNITNKVVALPDTTNFSQTELAGLIFQSTTIINYAKSFFCKFAGFIVRPFGWCQPGLLSEEISQPTYFSSSKDGVTSSVIQPPSTTTINYITNKYITYQSSVGITENDFSARLNNLAETLRSDFSNNNFTGNSLFFE